MELYKSEAFKITHRSFYLDRKTTLLTFLKKIDYARQLELKANGKMDPLLHELMFELERMFQVDRFLATPSFASKAMIKAVRLLPKKLRTLLGFLTTLTLGVLLQKIEPLLETILLDEPEVCDRTHELVEEMCVSALSRASELRVDLGFVAMYSAKAIVAPWAFAVLKLIPEVAYFLNCKNIVHQIQSFDFSMLKSSWRTKVWIPMDDAGGRTRSEEDHFYVKSA